MYTAQLPGKGPFVIRYPRGKGTIIDWHQPWQELPVGKGECLKEGKDLAVITIGTMATHAEKAINIIENESNVTIAHYDARFVKPLDEELLHQIGKTFKHVVTVEDGVTEGGFGSAVLEFMADNNYQVDITRLGIPDSFIEHGTPEELYAKLNLNAEGLKNSFEKILNEESGIN